METAEIRRRWLTHFESRGHTVVPSASLISNEPGLLLVNAGMVPFVPYLTGRETPPYKRATSVQKVVRTVDIEEVGKTTRHGSFFQMNGNFSFGDYFKEGAITYAWELLTKSTAEGGYGFPPERLWASVYHDDDEAAGLWQRITGMPASRIQRRGMKDNLWSMGVPGPCGPSSEIFFDRGPAYGPDGGPEVDEERFIEIWNLVFMQYERGPGGGKENYEIVGNLPQKNIDTGMGLERVACLLQGVENLYEVDEVYPILARASDLTGQKYGADHESDVRLRVVADHVRTGLMLIGDGVTPGNEGRGYVLRRILRRAIRAMRLLGTEDRVLPELLPVSKDQMKASYPELERDFDRISSVAYAEEESFRSTLRAGTTILDTAVREAKTAGQTSLGGDRAFQLHDTYGFPIDLTLEMAAEQGLAVDEDGFRRLMTEQRTRAKADSAAKKSGGADVSAYREIVDRAGRVEFTGYDEVVSEGVVRGLLRQGAAVPAAGEGDEVEIVLDRTPFYAEGGGQLADAGTLALAGGGLIEVYDVQQPVPGLIVHRARVTSGEVRLDLAAEGRVDIARRRAISRSHTATHMVHKAFREALGETATQAGSENSPGRFRFDFAAAGSVPPTVLHDVEQRVNELLIDDLPVQAELMSQAEAVSSGAMALFGEKYGDTVRVVSVGDWARELCGGTHAQRSGQLGIVKLLGESSIGAGVRRVEALVGTDAYSYLAREHVLLSQLTDSLKVRTEELPERIAGIVARLREAEKELERMRGEKVLAAAGRLAGSPTDVFGVAFVGHRAPDNTTADDLRKLVLDVRGRFPAERPCVVAASATTNGRPVVIVAVNDRGREWGVKAGELVKLSAGILGGGGGGKDDVAQGGGTDPARIDEAMAAMEQFVGQRVTGSA